MQLNNSVDTATRRFIVIQVGARMNYAVAAVFARHGMLDRLYTDIHADSALLTRAARLLPERVSPKPMRRLLGRRIPESVSLDSVRSFPLNALVRRKVGGIEEYLGQQLLKDGFGTANAIYTMTTADREVVQAAKRRGLFVVHEQFIAPDELETMDEERRRFSGIEPRDSAEVRSRFIADHQEQWRWADLILCPSPPVQESAIALGADAEKTVLLPYGIHATWLDYRPRPVAGRVLAVGSVCLRKGHHYLAEASRLLKARGVACDLRVVGPHPSGIDRMKIFDGPNYLGQIPRAEVHREFLSADVFVLPTLSEAFPAVVLEALACGLPVVTTDRCSSVVRDGIEGFVVPLRDPVALAESIERILADRHLRQSISVRARAQARNYTWERYEERLTSAVRGVTAEVAS